MELSSQFDESVPAHQRETLNIDDHWDRRQALLGLAKKPQPGTVLWRIEHRPNTDAAHEPTSVGMHWTVNPDVVTGLPPHHNDTRPVVYEAEVHQPEEQTYPRNHPIYFGVHRSMDGEAEVRLKHGSAVHLRRAYAWDTENNGPRSAPFYPMKGKLHPGWVPHDVDATVDVEHRSSTGICNYEQFGIPK